MSNWAVVIATCAAAIAAILAFLYTKELNKPILSLVKTEINMELKWNFLDIKFEFENVGNETLKITKFLIGRYDTKVKHFDYIEEPPLVNLLPPKQKFVYRRIMDIDKKVAKELLTYMEKNFPEGKVYDRDPTAYEVRKLFGKSLIVFSLEYKGTSWFSFRKIPFKHFVSFDGTNKYESSMNEYNEIKEKLPEIFKIK